MAYLLLKDTLSLTDRVSVTNTPRYSAENPLQQDQELVDFLEQLVNCKAIWYTDLRHKAESLLEARLTIKNFNPNI